MNVQKGELRLLRQEALRKFYEKDSYALLKNESTFENLKTLANFWNDVSNQNVEKFSNRVLRELFILNYAPNSMWTYFVSVYFMQNKDKDGLLEDEQFYIFLNRITAFIWTYALTNPGVNALRTPVYAEMVKLVNGKESTFSDYKFQYDNVKNLFMTFRFYNGRPITKSVLTWWAFQNPKQKQLELEKVFEIEHIFSRSRQDKEKSLLENKSLELLGNKSILEKKINIRASDYKFEDKKKYYKGFLNSRNQKKEGTEVQELIDLSESMNDFTEKDIKERNDAIINGFLSYLKSNDLVVED